MQDFEHFMDNMGFLSEEDNLQFLEQLKICLPDNEGKLLEKQRTSRGFFPAIFNESGGYWLEINPAWMLPL